VKASVLRKGDLLLISRVDVATNALERMKGLLGRSFLEKDRALYLAPAKLIHTFFMKFDLDLIFVSKDMRVVKIARGVGPGRVMNGGAGAHGVFEAQAGWIDGNAFMEGDVLSLKPE